MVAKKLRLARPGARSLSGDSFRRSLKPHLPQKYDGFDVTSEAGYIDYYTNHQPEALQGLRQQADALREYYACYIESTQHESDDDLILDGIDIWPDSFSADKNYREIYLIDTSPDQYQRVLQHDNEHSWMRARGMTPEQIKVWAAFSAVRSQRIKDLCEQNQKKYIDLAATDFNEAQDEALAYLTKS